MSDTFKSIKTEVDCTTIPVQKGLFEYPLPEGDLPALIGNRCRDCGKTFFPKRYLCPHCFFDGNLENVRLSRYGVIYATTVVHISSPLGIKAPYAYGFVDLVDNDLRVFALFSGHDPTSFVPGRKVELILDPIRKDTDGKTILGYKFKLVE